MPLAEELLKLVLLNRAVLFIIAVGINVSFWKSADGESLKNGLESNFFSHIKKRKNE